MWRLEAVRKKGGRKSIGIISGFRSVAYNNCIAGARASQHLYGTAADNRMVGVKNRREREIAKRSQIHGISLRTFRLTRRGLDMPPLNVPAYAFAREEQEEDRRYARGEVADEGASRRERRSSLLRGARGGRLRTLSSLPRRTTPDSSSRMYRRVRPARGGPATTSTPILGPN